ncbi:AAA family ATPase [Anabaena cylindrica FACHB-243]|uniref:AAA ATPase n=1 Tax=Anabaena cylindrica (strain ATCC 27899 / PCC 7122) TaxID=272123 RepID=K9ZEW5_ANACC|nr:MULTISPECIES: ATP-binding protein [Anabaena]AFZ57279.1 AAA ATPase [Anabaena cylindrica PCC 7122]MBD2420949.1 AAA family ATPase [Anabaena cylindrica FACHB-243]MBY5283450.1 ATP-binding protein [Anabaena sp. CCAP 1446/1C]MBY5307025.1 ATP-binding protein [Anabaena sp. CCAP 1446/1C]MCM2405702.1 AAA family ATPase [Anabaena sp. CCAP 1446/1C]
MSRWFNIAGPCNPEKHYTISATSRLPDLSMLIEQESYFVVHAPRQTGKTTAMLALAQQLTATGRYAAVMVSAEVGSAFNHDPGAAELAILGAWQNTIEDNLPPELQPPTWVYNAPGQRIGENLRAWSRAIKRPLVLFIDEIDSLQDQTLISILRQLRDGFPNRPENFPSSVGLIGLRDVRDYKVASGGSDRLNTSSPFNIKVSSITLRNFNAEEVAELYQQHTEETGQIFTPEATETAFDLTQGQPWLVNALAKEIVEKMVKDRNIAITKEHILQAKEILIARQDTHLDSLAERLREPRIKAIIEPMLAGLELGDIPNDDIQFVIDLGLCKMHPYGGLTIANPIYREVLPRVLTVTPMASLPMIAPTWLTPEGELNIDALLAAFLKFWRQHGEPLLGSTGYHEIAPHIVLMAFLHRVINGGGILEREYAIGSDRMDLCLRYKDVTLGIELKVWREKKRDPQTEGIEQLESYLGRLGLDFGWLFVFDRRKNALPMEERLSTEVVATENQRRITVIRA